MGLLPSGYPSGFRASGGFRSFSQKPMQKPADRPHVDVANRAGVKCQAGR